MNDKIKIEYIEKMKIAANQGNKEDNHLMADSVLCDCNKNTPKNRGIFITL